MPVHFTEDEVVALNVFTGGGAELIPDDYTINGLDNRFNALQAAYPNAANVLRVEIEVLSDTPRDIMLGHRLIDEQLGIAGRYPEEPKRPVTA